MSGAIAAHVTVPLPYTRAARSRRKTQLRYDLFGLLAQFYLGHEQVGIEQTKANSLIPFQPFQQGRSKLRHTLTDFVFVFSSVRSEDITNGYHDSLLLSTTSTVVGSGEGRAPDIPVKKSVIISLRTRQHI